MSPILPTPLKYPTFSKFFLPHTTFWRQNKTSTKINKKNELVIFQDCVKLFLAEGVSTIKIIYEDLNLDYLVKFP